MIQFDDVSANRSGLTGARILVVDDNRDAAVSLGMMLKLLGAETRVAHSGHDALTVAISWQPTAILLDIGMPEMDGYEVARQIRHDPELHDVLLVAMTGWDEDRERSEAAGFDHHLVKPPNLQVLNDLLVGHTQREAAQR